MTFDLSPCPKCGGKAKLRRGLVGQKHGPFKGNDKERNAKVYCLECGFTTGVFKPKNNGEKNEELYKRTVLAWEKLCKREKALANKKS